MGINNRRRILLDCTVTVFVHEPQYYGNTKIAVDESECSEDRFTIPLKGGETPFFVSVNSDSKYDLLIFIRDGKRFDLDKAINSYVVGQTVAQYVAVYFSTDSEKVSCGFNVCFGNIT